MRGQSMEDGFKAQLEEAPIESEPEMPSFATEEFIHPSVELDHITVDQSNCVTEVCAVLKSRLKLVHSR